MRRTLFSVRGWFVVLVALLGAAAPLTADSFLVLPFENASRAADLDWVGESFAEALTDNLQSEGLNAISREERSEERRVGKECRL